MLLVTKERCMMALVAEAEVKKRLSHPPRAKCILRTTELFTLIRGALEKHRGLWVHVGVLQLRRGLWPVPVHLLVPEFQTSTPLGQVIPRGCFLLGVWTGLVRLDRPGRSASQGRALDGICTFLRRQGQVSYEDAGAGERDLQWLPEKSPRLSRRAQHRLGELQRMRCLPHRLLLLCGMPARPLAEGAQAGV